MVMGVNPLLITWGEWGIGTFLGAEFGIPEVCRLQCCCCVWEELVSCLVGAPFLCRASVWPGCCGDPTCEFATPPP